jgi:hypothetical protein
MITPIDPEFFWGLLLATAAFMAGVELRRWWSG